MPETVSTRAQLRKFDAMHPTIYLRSRWGAQNKTCVAAEARHGWPIHMGGASTIDGLGKGCAQKRTACAKKGSNAPKAFEDKSVSFFVRPCMHHQVRMSPTLGCRQSFMSMLPFTGISKHDTKARSRTGSPQLSHPAWANALVKTGRGTPPAPWAGVSSARRVGMAQLGGRASRPQGPGDTRACAHACAHAYHHACTHACAHTCTRTRTYTCAHGTRTSMISCMLSRMRSCMHSPMHSCMHSCVHTCTRSRNRSQHGASLGLARGEYRPCMSTIWGECRAYTGLHVAGHPFGRTWTSLPTHADRRRTELPKTWTGRGSGCVIALPSHGAARRAASLAGGAPRALELFLWGARWPYDATIIALEDERNSTFGASSTFGGGARRVTVLGCLGRRAR